MGKAGVGQQTEKAVDNAMESMAKNIKFKRVVNFSITVLEEVCAQAGTNNKVNCEFIAQRKKELTFRQRIQAVHQRVAKPCIKPRVLQENLHYPEAVASERR